MTRNGPGDESADETPSSDGGPGDESGTEATGTDDPVEDSSDDPVEDSSDQSAEEASPEQTPGESTEDPWLSKTSGESATGGTGDDPSPDEPSPGTRPEEPPAEERSTEEPPAGEPPREPVPGEPATGESTGKSTTDVDAPGAGGRPADESPAGEATGEPAAGATADESVAEGDGRSLAYLGYSAVIVGFGGVLVSMLLTPWFSVFTGALSFLGFRRVAVAPLFNGSLIVGGALGAGLVATLWATAEQPFHLAAVPFLFLATVCMSLVGVFPFLTGPHFAVSAAFFAFLTVGIFLWGVGDYVAGRAARAATFLLLPVVHAVAWLWWVVLPWSPRGIALPELAGVVALVVWALWVSADLHGLTREPLPAF